MGRGLASLRVTLDMIVDFEQKSDRLPFAPQSPAGFFPENNPGH